MKKTCVQCKKEFMLTDSEIAFYKNKGLSLPKRCKECRDANRKTNAGMNIEKPQKNYSKDITVDTKTVKNRKSQNKKNNSFFYMIALIVVLVSLSVLCYFNSEITLTVFDSLTACILGFSAFLQSYMYREYYLIRPMAVLMALLLWVLVIFVNGFSMISFTMIVLYLMYLTNDLLTSAFWKITVDVVEPEELELVTSEGKKVLESERIEEYKKLVELENKNDKNSKGAVIFSCATSVFSFSLLACTSFKLVSSLGIILSIGLLTSYILSLVLIPSSGLEENKESI